MAGIITPQFGFRNATVEHSPSPLSFGFGLSSAAAVPGWQPVGMHTNSFSAAPSTIGSSQKSAQKRRHRDADDDELMERSPTPERRSVRPVKQLRVRPLERRDEDSGEGGKGSKDGVQTLMSESEVDVGMLLGELCVFINLF
jgi:hypothetical protein